MGRKSTLDGWWRAEATPKTYDSSGNALPWGRGRMTVGRRKWKCADQEPILPLFPVPAVRMVLLAGRKSLGWLQLKSLLVCPAVHHAGRMNVVWNLLQVPTDPTLLA